MTNLPVPDSAKLYVDILGVDDAIKFFLAFGGAELRIATAQGGQSQIVEAIGAEKAARLAASTVALKARVPIPKRWIAECLRRNGWSDAKIARTLHVSDTTLSRWKKYTPAGPDKRQLPLI